MQTTTQFDLLLYIYDELNQEDKQAIENQMKWDFDLRDEILSMKETKAQMDACQPRVRDSVVDSLIQYVRAANN
jgi:hypothetical protein